MTSLALWGDDIGIWRTAEVLIVCEVVSDLMIGAAAIVAGNFSKFIVADMITTLIDAIAFSLDHPLCIPFKILDSIIRGRSANNSWTTKYWM